MGFWGSSFTFDDIPCTAFELMLYDVGSDSQEATQFANPVTIVEEFLSTRWRPLFIGTKIDRKLEFQLVFGVNEERLDSGAFLDREELAKVANWLTLHDNYKWLEIHQDDMIDARYRCIVTGLECVEYGSVPWALRATITCDGPFAYRYPESSMCSISGTSTVVIENNSCLAGYYKPKIVYFPNSGGSLKIVNVNDKRRAFELKDMPGSVSRVDIDNENCLITNDADLNLYKGFNFNFLRLVPGANTLEITGDGEIEFICEYPANVGG